MAQTGLSSAVGLCIESIFRQVPLTLITGQNYGVGVPNTNPHRFFTIEPGGGLAAKPSISIPDNEIDGDVQLSRTVKEAMTYDGSFSFKVDGENIVFPLLGVMGRAVQTVKQAADSTHSPAVNSWMFTPFKYAPSFSVEEVLGDGTYARLSSGSVITKLELDFGKTVMGSLGITPHRQVPNVYLNATNIQTDYDFGINKTIIPAQMSTALGNGTNTWQRTTAPGFIDVPSGATGNGPFVFGAMTFGTSGTVANGLGSPNAFYMSYADQTGTMYGINADILEGVKLTFDRKIDSQMTAGSSFDPGAVTGSQFSTTGHIDFLFKDSSIVLAAIRHSQVCINFKLVGNLIGTSGQQYSLEVFLPHVKLTNVSGPSIVDGPLVVGCDFAAKKDPSNPNAVVITLQTTANQNTTPGMGGRGGISTNLTTASIATATSLVVTSSAGMVPGDQILIDTGSQQETRAIATIPDATHITVAALTYPHAIGAVVLNFTGGLGGWSPV